MAKHPRNPDSAPSGRCAVTGKFQHRSKSSAKQAIKRHLNEGTSQPGLLQAYRCEHCGQFHIGHGRIEGVVLSRETHRQLSRDKFGTQGT